MKMLSRWCLYCFHHHDNMPEYQNNKTYRLREDNLLNYCKESKITKEDLKILLQRQLVYGPVFWPEENRDVFIYVYNQLPLFY